MKNILISTLLLSSTSLFFACGDSAEDTSASYVCPTVSEDSCMTDALYTECLDVVSTCESGNILIAESCPYASFSCEE